jgi:hypothetical protein
MAQAGYFVHAGIAVAAASTVGTSMLVRKYADTAISVEE